MIWRTQMICTFKHYSWWWWWADFCKQNVTWIFIFCVKDDITFILAIDLTFIIFFQRISDKEIPASRFHIEVFKWPFFPFLFNRRRFKLFQSRLLQCNAQLVTILITTTMTCKNNYGAARTKMCVKHTL